MEALRKRGLNGPASASVSPQTDAETHKPYGVKSYGISRRGVRGNFVPPIKSNGNNIGNVTSCIAGKGEDAVDDSIKRCLELLCGPEGELPEKLRNLEPQLIEHVSNEIMDRDPNVRWGDIAGLEHAKKCVTEMIIWPLLRPDIFTGYRSPGRGQALAEELARRLGRERGAYIELMPIRIALVLGCPPASLTAGRNHPISQLSPKL